MEILTVVAFIKWQELYEDKYQSYLAGSTSFAELASFQDDLMLVAKYMNKGDSWDVPADFSRLSKICSRALRDSNLSGDQND